MKTIENLLTLKISKTLTSKQIQFVIKRTESMMERLVEDIRNCPLCQKFYYKDCRGCPYKQFEVAKDFYHKTVILRVGCKDFYNTNYGQFSSRSANEARIRIYSEALELKNVRNKRKKKQRRIVSSV